MGSRAGKVALHEVTAQMQTHNTVRFLDALQHARTHTHAHTHMDGHIRTQQTTAATKTITAAAAGAAAAITSAAVTTTKCVYHKDQGNLRARPGQGQIPQRHSHST